jgi:membrane protease YdiL (CAAX protease family)
MRHALRSLPPASEFAIVVLGAFGYFIVTSVLTLMWPGDAGHFSDAHLANLIVLELILLSLLLGFLYVRGWTFAAIADRERAVDLLIGFALALAAYLASWFIFYALSTAWPGAAGAMDTPGLFTERSLSLVMVIAVSIVNPVFEEVFVCGYVIAALHKQRNPWIGIHVSVAIRLLYHLYQGAAAISIVPFGLIFAVWYARTGRLWPVMIAHAITDFAALIYYVR